MDRLSARRADVPAIPYGGPVNAIQFFTAQGFTYEYPGYFSKMIVDSEYTVGIGYEPAVGEGTTTDASFTVQIIEQDGRSTDIGAFPNADAVVADFNCRMSRNERSD